MPNIKALTERRNEIVASMTKLVEDCAVETRAFNEEEVRAYEALKGEISGIDAVLDRADALSALETRRAGQAGQSTSTEELETRAFENYVRGIVETRAASNLDAGTNGAVIPTSIAKKIISKVYEICPVYQLANRYNVGGMLNIPYYDESTQQITMGYRIAAARLCACDGAGGAGTGHQRGHRRGDR